MALESNYSFLPLAFVQQIPKNERQIHLRIYTWMKLLYIMLLIFFTIGSTRVSEIVFSVIQPQCFKTELNALHSLRL